jgi:hypothetical protein
MRKKNPSAKLKGTPSPVSKKSRQSAQKPKTSAAAASSSSSSSSTTQKVSSQKSKKKSASANSAQRSNRRQKDQDECSAEANAEESESESESEEQTDTVNPKRKTQRRVEKYVKEQQKKAMERQKEKRKKKKWDSEDSLQLLQIVANIGKKWEEVANTIHARHRCTDKNANSLRKKYQSLLAEYGTDAYEVEPFTPPSNSSSYSEEEIQEMEALWITEEQKKLEFSNLIRKIEGKAPEQFASSRSKQDEETMRRALEEESEHLERQRVDRNSTIWSRVRDEVESQRQFALFLQMLMEFIPLLSFLMLVQTCVLAGHQYRNNPVLQQVEEQVLTGTKRKYDDFQKQQEQQQEQQQQQSATPPRHPMSTPPTSTPSTRSSRSPLYPNNLSEELPNWEEFPVGSTSFPGELAEDDDDAYDGPPRVTRRIYDPAPHQVLRGDLYVVKLKFLPDSNSYTNENLDTIVKVIRISTTIRNKFFAEPLYQRDPRKVLLLTLS